MAFNISQPIDVRSKCANIDVLYGPYDSISAACTAIIPARRVIGRTVGIIDNGSILEYWWKAGLEDSDLVQKVEQLTLSLHLVGDSTFTRDEGEPIYGRFMVEGGAGVKRAVLYQIIDGNEVYLQEYTNIGKGSTYTFQIQNPTVSGVYTYHLKVIDSLDNYAITSENTNYIEYTLRYGGISTIYNLTQLNSITVKNYESVANQPFQLNISVRDESFRITNVCFTDSTDEHPEPRSVQLTPYSDPFTPSDTFLGNNYYFLPDSSELAEHFNGKQCSIVVSYMEGEESMTKTQDLFKLLDIGTLEIVPEYEGGDYYGTLPGYYTFTLRAGVENLSIVLTQGENSDFAFEKSTVLAYRRFSLKVIPNNIVKENAQIVINYRYVYDNHEYHGTFTRIIGNILQLPPQAYYEPEQGDSTSMIKMVDANSEDYTGIDDGQYYKLISDDVITSQLSCSFLLDTYCKINQQNDKTIKYIRITYGGVEVATVTEDEISCVNQWRSLYTDTPINEWTQIGIGINLKETITRNNQPRDVRYHAIYINGMVVKTVLIDDDTIRPLPYSDSNRLIVTVGNGILVQKCFLYYRNDGEEIIFPNVMPQGTPSIIYNNYKSHKRDFSEPDNLPVLKFLRISNTEEYERYFALINAHKDDKIKHLTTFGVIGAEKAPNMNVYDSNYSSAIIESDATLFRQSVEIKKPAQKEYAVLCRVQWMGSIMEDIIVEVHTQGTSTLVYTIPNFKFTFWQLQGNDVVPYYGMEFIKIEGTDDYYHECIYTAKADFMDSSHLNNTPTCNYYNNLIKNLISENVITGSPSARNDMLDAIMGFPIVMEISDTASTFEDIFTNIGSFMLNIDKTGNSLGFEIDEGGQHLSCISFEGTSNDNEHGAAGRFDIPDGTTLKDYTNNLHEVDEAEITNDYNFVRDNILGQKGPNDTVVYEGQTILAKEQPYVKWCIFLSDGLEYRYPDSDMYKEKNGYINKVMKLSDFIKLYTMWQWVNKSDTLSQVDYKTQFVQHFDLHYCMIYFINLMIYAQTDNLGKNAMFDCWDGTHWYPRPYDLDSEAGLDNNGNDNVAPFVEIKPVFSLNYDPLRADDYDWLADNYLIDDEMSAEIYEETGLVYPASTIQYGAQTYDRYHFSSNKSKLWINFYKNFKSEIEAFYSDLRNNYAYTPESIIMLCNDVLIGKLGTAQYNQDFQNKYLASSDQRLSYGNRWYKFKKWITKRFAFCDSYFGATETGMYNLTSRINYNVKVDAPQYVIQQYQGNQDVRFVLDTVSFNAGSGAATIIALVINQPSVFETSLFKNVVYNNGPKNYSNLISLDVSGNTNPQFTNITSVTGSNLNNLKYLNISNSAVQNLDVPINVKTLLAEGVNLSTFTIPNGCAVEEISFKGSTFLGPVDLSGLPNLKRLDLTDCTFKNVITFADLPQLDELVMTRAIFEDEVIISEGVNVTSFDFSDLNLHKISFSGSNLEIDTINFRRTKFGVDTLNLNAIMQNIRNLYFDECQGLTHLQIIDGGTFGNLYCLSLYGSSIKALGDNNAIFNCSHFTNIAALKKVSSYLPNGIVIYTDFNFYYTFIEQITNITWNGSGSSLFRDCQQLTSILGTLNLANSVDYMFYRCYLLATLPTINMANSVTSASNLFAGCSALSYASVLNVIRQCTNVSNFSSVLRCKQFENGQTISLNDLFGNNTVAASTGVNLSSAFSCYTGGDMRSVTNNVTITGKIKSNVSSTSWMFYGFSSINVPYDVLSTAINLSDASIMFASSNVTFTGDANTLPSQTDAYSESVTLTHAVDYRFFPTSLVNIASMFFDSNVITNDGRPFRNLTNLSNTNSTFGSTSVKAFSFTNSHSETELINVDVSNAWVANPAITTIAGCFANIYNVSCNALHFHQDITSSRTIDISGLFGLNNNSMRAAVPIQIDIDGIVPNLTTDSYYAVPTNSRYAGPGTFQNRSVIINTTPVNGKIFAKLNSICRNTFNGTILYLPSSVTTFDLSNVDSNAYAMFANSRLYTLAEQGHTYGLNDRKFVNVLLPTRCATYTYMFSDSSVLASLPALRSTGAADLSYMYEGCVINTADLELPYNYFQICAASITNVSYMFQNNMYITTLGYNANRGLFEGCTNLSNVNGMFQNAYFLHKGIPVNLFGTTELPRLTSLSSMFESTSIIYDVEDNSNKWLNAETLEPLVNLENIQRMFYQTKIHLNEYTSTHGTLRNVVTNIDRDVAVIDTSTFTTKTITNISYLFKFSRYAPPTSVGRFRFMGFTIGTEAFFASYIPAIDSNFVDSNYVASIANVDRMFYQTPYGSGHYHGTITNLDIFTVDITDYPNMSKRNIAGNIVDAGIAETYKQSTTQADANYSYGFSLIQPIPSTLEDVWVNYPRHIYTTS